MRKYVGVLLGLVLLVSLCGCGGDTTAQAEPAPQGQQSTQQTMQSDKKGSSSSGSNGTQSSSGSKGQSSNGSSGSGAQSSNGSSGSGTQSSSGSSGQQSGDFEPYQAPPFAKAEFREEEAVGSEDAMLDLSGVSEGYVGVSAKSDKRLKFQVLKDDQTYNYDIASDGTPSVLPLQGGDGTYTFRVMENVVDKKYVQKYAEECEVKLKDEFQPFLRPSDYVNYTEDSRCVQKARELAESADGEMGVVSAVYDYICDSVVYDRQKAESVKSGYLPDPDETMTSGKGICFDYASLAAAMLRSQGIPTKMIFGYVSPDDLYHAWNMFYTHETGWVTVEYKVSEDTWNRLDLTFSANGADGTFIGDGTNYTDTYFY